MLLGGKGDDLLDGDITGAVGPVPGPNPSHDVCNGQQGSDSSYGCEQANQIETVLPFP